MSKHTVTMKSLIDENAQLRVKVHQLEAELAAYKRRFWPRLVELVKSGKGKRK
jgi:hypothetical protein